LEEEEMRKLSVALVVVAMALLMAPVPALATPPSTLVVDADGFGAIGDCGNTTTPAYPTIGLAIATANSGDTVDVCPGTYPESPDITKSLTLESTGGRAVTTIELEVPGPGTPYLASLTIRGPDVTVRGFTIVGRDADCSTLPPTLAVSNVQLSGSVNSAVVADNLIEVGASDNTCSTGDDGIGVITTFSTTVNVNSLTVDNNIFQPLNSQGTRAFYINPGVEAFTFSGNTVNGKFTRNSLTHAMNGLVDSNTFDGGGLGGRGVGTWGYPDAAVWGHTTFSNNDIENLISGITINESNAIVIEHNELTNDTTGVSILDGFGASNFDPSTIDIHLNNITGNATAGADNGANTPGTVDGTCNWWGAISGPTNAGNPGGSGDTVVGDVDFKPWLIAKAPDGACTGGTKLKPTITTKLSESAGIKGDTVHDSATLVGATSDAGGTVDYRYYGSPTACAADTAGTGGTDVGIVTVTGGVVPDSASVPFNTAGTVYWAAFYSGDTKNEAAKSDCASEPLVIATQVAKITPTGTTCQQYQSGTAATLGQVLYTVDKGGKIGAVSPGVFFYYTRVSGSAGDTVTITQSHTGSAPTFPIQMKQVLLYSDPGCATLKWRSLTVNQDGTASGVLPSTGNFIISVKYDASAIKGKPVPVPATSTYSFGTNKGTPIPGTPIPADIARMDLAKK
jgi:hypothetical protein